MRLTSLLAMAGMAYPTYRFFTDVMLESISISGYHAEKAWVGYLFSKCRLIGIGNRKYESSYDTNEDKRAACVKEVLSKATRCFILPGRVPVPVWARIVDSPRSSGEGFNNSLEVLYVRGTVDPDDLASEVMLESEKFPGYHRHYQFDRVFPTSHSVVEHTQIPMEEFGFDEFRSVLRSPTKNILDDLPVLALKDLPLSEEQQKIFREVKVWLSSRKWYMDRSIPWRRGYLLHGPPGTGKTTFVKTLARELKMHVASFALHDFGNQSFEKTWPQWVDGCPRIVLLEDLDAIFNGRKNIVTSRMSSWARGDSVKKNRPVELGAASNSNAGAPPSSGGMSLGGISWDCFLSTLDYTPPLGGVLLFVTTNHPEVLDPSLACVCDGEVTVRPGRIDSAVSFGSLDYAGRLLVAERLLGCTDRSKRLIRDMEGATVAQVQEACVKASLEDLWSSEKVTEILER